MVISGKHNWINITLSATIWSVLGGIVGYYLGFYLYDFVEPLIHDLGKYEQYLNAKSYFQKYGIVFLFIAAFTPIPYKVFTIASGLIGFNLLIFIVISFISRGFRFFLVSYLSSKFGDSFTNYMNQHGQKWFTILGIIVVFIVAIFYISMKFNG